MKTASVLPFRLLALGFSLSFAVSPSVAVASQTSQTGPRAAQHLAARDSLPLKAVGPYVHAGTFRIQVSTKLGRPDFALPDGTWLYDGYALPQGGARGTLVVRFVQGRVSHLSLVSPAFSAALRQHANDPASLLASQR